MSDTSIYPNAIDGYAQLPLIIDNVSKVDAVTVNRLRSAIVKIETELGILPSGEFENLSERLQVLDLAINDLEVLIDELSETVGELRSGALHAISHQQGGTDQISIDGLLGEAASAQKVAISKNSGAVVGSRSALNLIEGSNVFLTITDDSISNEIDVEISAGVGLHDTSHQFGGSDEISLVGLSGETADPQKTAITKNSGAIVGSRSTLNLIEGANISLTITDDGVDNEVDIEISAGVGTHAASHQNGGLDEISLTDLSGEAADPQKIAITKNSGAIVGSRSTLNLIEGTNISLTIADDGIDNEVDVTIASNPNVFSTITDGVTSAVASGADTFKLRSANALLSIATQNNDITHGDNALFTLNETSIDHANITGIGTNTHVQIDTHISSTSNPHATSIANLGSGTLSELNTAVSDTNLVGENYTFAGDVGGSPTATTVTDLTITSEAQGDLLYRNATNWVRLAAGTSGKFLKTLGAGADPAWDTPTGPTYSDTLANIQAITPLGGEMGFPTDSPYMLVGGSGSWKYLYRGTLVTPPVSGNWSDKNLQAGSTRSFSDGTQYISIDTRGVTLYREGAVATLANNSIHTIGFISDFISGETTATCAVGAGLLENATSKNIIIQWASNSDGAFSVIRSTAIDSGAASTPINLTEVRHLGNIQFVQLERSSGTIYFRTGPGPTGPWRLLNSEADASFFTTAADRVFIFAINRTGINDFPLILFHHAIT